MKRSHSQRSVDETAQCRSERSSGRSSAKRQRTASASRRSTAKNSAAGSGRGSGTNSAKRMSTTNSKSNSRTMSRTSSECKINRSRESSVGPGKLKGRWPKNRLKFKTWADEEANDLVKETLIERGWKFDVKGHMCDPDNLDDLLNVARKTDYVLWWLDEEEARIISKCRGHHRVNCIQGMSSATRKTTMSLLKGVKGADWYPKTLVLPQDAEEARRLTESNEVSTWIVKPMTGWAGHNIIVYRSDQPEFREFIEAHANKRNVIQRYISNPLLIDGLKFGLRIYTLITSLNPLQIFLNTNACHAWFASQEYTNDVSTMGSNFVPRVHLTNRSVNMKPLHKENSEPCWKFITRKKPHLGKCIEMRSEDLFAYCEKHFGKGSDHIWDQAIEICRHTMHAMANYKLVRDGNEHLKGKNADRAFELFGVDIMVDANLKLWLCEVNSSPGLGKCPETFGNGEPNPNYDYYCNIRRGVIHDTMRLLGLDACPMGEVENWVPLGFD